MTDIQTRIDYPSLDNFIKNHIRFKQHYAKRVIGLRDAHWQELKQPTFIQNIVFASGSLFKVFETSNFGWIVFAPGTLTIDGNEPGRRIFKWQT